MLLSPTPSAEALALAKEDAAALRAAISKLRVRHREVIELVLAGHSRLAVATRLGTTTKASEHLEARALARLAAKLTTSL